MRNILSLIHAVPTKEVSLPVVKNTKYTSAWKRNLTLKKFRCIHKFFCRHLRYGKPASGSVQSTAKNACRPGSFSPSTGEPAKSKFFLEAIYQAGPSLRQPYETIQSPFRFGPRDSFEAVGCIVLIIPPTIYSVGNQSIC